MGIMIEEVIETKNYKIDAIAIKVPIDMFNYEILVGKLNARVYIGEKMLVLDLKKCNSFSVDAIKSLEKVSDNIKSKDGIICLLNCNQKVKFNFSLLEEEDKFVFLDTDKFIDNLNAGVFDKYLGDKKKVSELHFTVYYKNAILNRFTFKNQRVVIGRRSSCDIVLPDEKKMISREHTIIEIENDEVIITNKGKNKTYIDNKPIDRFVANDNTLFKIEDYLIQLNF